MIKANINDKDDIVNLLACSFDDNKSVNYIIRQGSKRSKYIKALMGYAFDMCYEYGEVYISDDRKSCALILLPDRKRTTPRSIWRDIKLALGCVGLTNILKAMRRESEINNMQPDAPLYYLWFLGVEPEVQGKGIGSALLKALVERGRSIGRTICLETSTLKNLPWYAKHGFEVYAEKDFGYPLYFLKL